MKVLKINKKNIELLKKVVARGGVVGVPTETVYGFSCDPSNEKAVEKIYKIKGMGFNKPLLLLSYDLKVVQKHFKMNKTEKELAKKYWPGALNIILQLKEMSSAGVPEKCGLVVKNKQNLKFRRQNNEAAVRISSDKLMQELARECGGFVSSTSANRTGEKECLSGKEVFNQFKDRRYKPDIILDAGKLETKIPSTIVKINGRKIEIIRQGEVKVK